MKYLFILLLILSHRLEFLIPSKIYYSPPEFSVKNSNVTFVTARLVRNNTKGQEDSLENLGKSMMIVCQADMINRKTAQIAFDGTMNIAFKDYTGRRGSGQDAIIDLLSNSLYYKNNNSRLSSKFDLTGFMGISDYGTNEINSLATDEYAIPFLSNGDSARSNADNEFVGYIPAENYSFFDILNTEYYTSFNVILQLSEYFNWTMLGNLYEETNYGYTRQRSVITYSGYESTPIFTCNNIVPNFDTNRSVANSTFDDYCECIKSKETIQVTILWMSSPLAIEVISYLRENCSGSRKWTFVITNDYQNVAVYYRNYAQVFDSTLLLRNNGPWDIKSYIKDCNENASPEARETIQELIGSYYKIAYNCYISDNESYDVEKCSEKIFDRNVTCKCTGNEFNQDQYASKYFFSADMTSAWAYAINLIQKNCTFLNEQVLKFDEKRSFTIIPTDFCSLTTFTPTQLSFALRFINFTGYTGEIYFTDAIMRRAIKSYFLYSVNGSIFNDTLVGQFNYKNYTINESLIKWPDNEIPTSEITTQNPDLSYAVVDVFFGIAILEMIICTILIILYLINFNDPIIKRSAPIVTFLILIGIKFMALSQLIFSLKKSHAICTLTVFTFHIGIILVITGLLVRSYRVYKIFSNKDALPVLMPESKLLWAMGLFSGIYILIIVVFVCVFGYDALTKTSSYSIYYKYIECAIPDSPWDTIFIFLLQIPILLLLVINLVLAWLTRKVRTEYRDTNSLASIVCILFASYVLFIPLGLTFNDKIDCAIMRYVIHVEFITIVIVSALGILFVPKMYVIYMKKKKNRRLEHRD